MKIRLTPFTYLRSFKDECLLFNPRTEAFSLSNNAGAVFGSLSSVFKETSELFSSASVELGVSTDQIEHDFIPLLADLASVGLVELVGTEINEATTSKFNCMVGKTGGTDDIEQAIGFFKRNCLPLEIHIDLTSACNEQCVHCYYVDHQNRHMPFEMVDKVLREFRAAQGISVYLSGGECLLHPDFDRICRLCKSLDLNIIVMSNLTLCSESRIALLREVDPQFINVSLYSMDSNVHDSITRVPGSWRKTMDAFLACEKAGLHLRIASPLLRENRESFDELERFAKDHNVHIVPDYMIFAKTNHEGTNLCHACSGHDLESVLRSNKKLFGDTILTGRKPDIDSKVCRIGENRICINAKGDYYPCDGMHEYVLGNAAVRTLLEIWNGKEMLALRRLKVRDFKKCVPCSFRRFCMICPAHNFNATGDIFIPGTSKCDAAEIAMRVYGETEIA